MHSSQLATTTIAILGNRSVSFHYHFPVIVVWVLLSPCLGSLEPITGTSPYRSDPQFSPDMYQNEGKSSVGTNNLNDHSQHTFKPVSSDLRFR